MSKLERCCSNCSNKYIDQFDTECKCWCCSKDDSVMCMYENDSSLLFHSCLNYRSYDEMPFYSSIIKVSIDSPIHLLF